MTYRILVDENTSPRVAELLRGKGHEAAHVSEALEVGFIVSGTLGDGFLAKVGNDIVRD